MFMTVNGCKYVFLTKRLRFLAKRLAGWRHFIQVGSLIPTSPFWAGEVGK